MLKIIRASRLVLGPVVWILKIALVKELTSLLRPETILASSSVPSSSSLFVEKKLVSKDLANKEVTLQLQVTNGEEAEKPTGELIIVMLGK